MGFTVTSTFYQNQGLLNMNPDGGMPTSQVTATISGFGAGEVVSFTYNYGSVNLGACQTDLTGGCVFTFTVPYIQASSSSYMVYATGQQSGISASEWFYQEWPYMSWGNGPSGAPGEWKTVFLYSFLPFEIVDITYNNTLVATCPMDRNGNNNGYGCGFYVPYGNPTGVYTVTFQGETLGLPVTAAFNQNAAAIQLSPGSGLPGTQVVATGYGFEAGKTVAFTYGSINVGNCQADADRRVCAHVRRSPHAIQPGVRRLRGDGHG